MIPYLDIVDIFLRIYRMHEAFEEFLLNNLVEPTMGAVPSYKALAIIVLGGLGSVRGALVASLALGIIESFGTIYVGHLLDRDSIAFAFLILVLMVRPQGLLTRG